MVNDYIIIPLNEYRGNGLTSFHFTN